MSPKFLIASDHGVRFLQKEKGDWTFSQGVLANHQFTSIVCQDQTILAGAKDGLFLSLDKGESWQQVTQGLSHPHIRAVYFHPDEHHLAYAGTEPAAIFVSQNYGLHWRECSEVSQLREKHDWHLPYSPRAGCVRDFAFQGKRGYAAVEQGGFLRSNNWGRTWNLMDKEESEHIESSSSWIHIDVHSVFINPSSADNVFAPTGKGLYVSSTGGRSWEEIQSNYCRAIWVGPQQEQHIILGTADSADKNGRIEESRNGGITWSERMQGLESIWPEHMVNQFLQYDEQLFAVLSNGALISSSLNALSWKTIFDSSQATRAISLLA